MPHTTEQNSLWSGKCLTLCKSAAGDQLTAYTNQRFLSLAARRVASVRSAGPAAPVGCICLLGANRGAELGTGRSPGGEARCQLGPSGVPVRRAPRCLAGPRARRSRGRGRMLRPPLRSAISPARGRRHSARRRCGPGAPKLGAANVTSGSPAKDDRDGGRSTSAPARPPTNQSLLGWVSV
jgi:hypothetical protein